MIPEGRTPLCDVVSAYKKPTNFEILTPEYSVEAGTIAEHKDDFRRLSHVRRVGEIVEKQRNIL